MERDLQIGIGFAAKAEAARQAGRLEEAEQIVRAGLQREPASISGRIVLASVLFDAGARDEAQASLEAVLIALPGFDAELVAQRTLSTQTASLASLQESIVIADTAGIASEEIFAESALELTDDDSPTENAVLLQADGADEFAAAEATARAGGSDESGTLSESFATGTVARLLEEQGHADAAQEIRVVLSQKNQVGAKTQDEEQSGRDRIVGTLEQWLENLRGGVQ